MSEDSDFRFQIAFTGKVDTSNAVIRDVSLITGNLTAEGHALEVDDETLKQVLECGKKMKKIPVYLDHGSGFKEAAGYVDNVRLDSAGGKVRGDWNLLKTEQLTPKLMEMAERMPETFGLSLAFRGKGVKGKGGKEFARCTKVLSVDCVKHPAANPEGLFSVPVDTGKKGMADPNPSSANPEPSLADVLAAVNALGDRITAIEQFNSEVQQHLQEPDLGELAQMTDEQLDQAGFDVQAVRAAIEQAQANGELESDAAPAGATGAAPEGGAAPAGGAVGAELSALRKEVIRLSAIHEGQQRAAEAAEVEHAFSVIEEKVVKLSARNDELEEQNQKLAAEVKTLKFAVKTGGGRPVTPSKEGLHLLSAGADGELHEFQQLVKKHKDALMARNFSGNADAEAIRLAHRENPAAHEDYITSLEAK